DCPPDKCCQDGDCVAQCDPQKCFKPDCNGGQCESECDPDKCEKCDGNGNCIVCDGNPCKECKNGKCKTRPQPCKASLGPAAGCSITEGVISVPLSITNKGECEDRFRWVVLVTAGGEGIGWSNGEEVAHGTTTLAPSDTYSTTLEVKMGAASAGGDATLTLYVCNSS